MGVWFLSWFCVLVLGGEGGWVGLGFLFVCLFSFGYFGGGFVGWLGFLVGFFVGFWGFLGGVYLCGGLLEVKSQGSCSAVS